MRARARMAAIVVMTLIASLFSITPSLGATTPAMSAGIAFPANVTVGQSGLTATITLTNQTQTDTVGETTALTVDSIQFWPSCSNSTASFVVCTPDANTVFGVSATGTGGGAFAGRTFTITGPAGDGSFTATPDAAITLGDTGGPSAQGTVSFTISVLRSPATDAAAGTAGNQTRRLVVAAATTVADAEGATGTGNGTTTVAPALPPVVTSIHDENHVVIGTSADPASVAVGTTVHDSVKIENVGVGPAPTGTVTFHWFTTADCTGASVNSGPIALGAPDASNDVTVDATAFTQTPTTVGAFGFHAVYSGDSNYLTNTSLCEPLYTADAKIEITPATDTNAVGTNHILTITVTAAGGTLSAGTATASLVPGSVGSFVGSPTCNYLAAASSSSCTVTITSLVTGTSTVSASSSIGVNTTGGTVTLSRTTDGSTTPSGLVNSGPASKVWVDSSIRIDPQNDTNPADTNHVFTITVTAINGPLAAGTATAAIESGPGSFVGSPTCNYAAAAVSSTCQVTITSAVTGVTEVSATSNISVSGQVMLRTTDPDGSLAGPGGSDNAEKAWVNANIQINPQTDTNAVGTNHVFTITVNSFGGSIAAGTATAAIVSGPGSFVGSPTCNYAAAETTSSCTVTITSAVVGTTVVSATSTITVAGLAMLRTTNPDGSLAGPGGTDNAEKTWVDSNILIDPQTDTNAVGTNHVFTITVNSFNGPLAAGTATAAIQSGPGSFVGSPSCNYAAAASTSTCQVTITSAVAGLTVVSATSNISVSGQVMLRTTNPDGSLAGPGGSDNAEKAWVDANIQINPQNATNPLNTTHTFTITVNSFNGPLAAGTATAAIESGPGSFVGPNTCNYAAAAATSSCTVTITSAIAGTTVVSATSNITVSGQTMLRTTHPDGSLAGPGGTDNAEKVWIGGECFVLWDEEALDNDFRTVENAARLLSVTPDALINDDRPTEGFNPPLLWNTLRAASGLPADSPAFQVRISTGQDKDEGWYVLPPEISYSGLRFTNANDPFRTDSSGNVIDDTAWIQALIDGTLPQSRLDKIKHVQPLRNRDLATMVGKTCVALVWDSDISMNYNGYRTGNLQGARLGLFTFQVIDVVQPQAYPPVIPESTSSTSFFDVIIRVLPPATPAPEGSPVNNVLLPDTVQITRARCRNGTLEVRAETNRSSAVLFIAVEGLVSEESIQMMASLGSGRWLYTANGVNCTALRNDVVTVYSSGGGNPLAPAAFGSGGTYNARISN